MGPLDGVRVIEIASLAPAPFGCMVLSDLGADVLRVDRVDRAGRQALPPVDPLARGRRSIRLNLVPVRCGGRQSMAPRDRLQGPDHDTGGGELLLHPGDTHRDVARRQAKGGGHLAAVKLATRLKPPQRQQFAVGGVEPAGRLRGFLTLARQAEPQQGQVHEVGPRVGHLRAEAIQRRGLPGLAVIAQLTDGDSDQPGPERAGIAQVPHAAHDPQHGLLHDIIHIGVPVQGPPDNVVNQRQVLRQQVVQRPLVALLRGDHSLHARPAASGHPHATSRFVEVGRCGRAPAPSGAAGVPSAATASSLRLLDGDAGNRGG
jgi:hypothetical protein